MLDKLYHLVRLLPEADVSTRPVFEYKNEKGRLKGTVMAYWVRADWPVVVGETLYKHFTEVKVLKHDLLYCMTEEKQNVYAQALRGKHEDELKRLNKRAKEIRDQQVKNISFVL